MRVAGGAMWAVGARLSTQGFQFAAGIVLARILDPADFGLLAAVYAITGIAVLLLDFGLSAVVVRWVSPTQAELSTMFWLNLVNGVVLAALMSVAAPLIAGFYQQDALLYLAPLASLAFLFGCGAVHIALLSRAGDFKALSIITGIGSIVTTTSTLGLAVAGAGPLALAIGPAIGSLFTALGVIFRSRWKPSFVFERAAVVYAWRFSRGVVGAQSIEYVLQNVDSVLLGRQWGPAILGVYNRAFSLMIIPVNQITGAVGSVVYPALAGMQADQVRLRVSFERAASVIFSGVGLIVVELAITAPHVVQLLYGERWAGSIVPLQWLCIAGFARVTTLTTGWLLQVINRTDVMLRLAVIEAVLTVTGIVIAVQFGAGAVAFAVAVGAVIYLPINLKMTYRAFGESALGLATQMARSALCIGLAALVTALLTVILAEVPNLVAVAAALVAGVVVFVLAAILVDRPLLRGVRIVLQSSA